MEPASTRKLTKILKYTCPLNSIYPLLCDGAHFAYINGDHDHVFRYKPYLPKENLGWIGEKFYF